MSGLYLDASMAVCYNNLFERVSLGLKLWSPPKLMAVWKRQARMESVRSMPMVTSRTCLAYSLLACSVLSLSISAHAQISPSGSIRRSPAEVVKRYVHLDQKGARLEAASFDTLVPYISWKEEPAWNRLIVVQNIQIPEDYRKWEIIDNLEVIIPVTFQVRGAVYLETAAFLSEETTEEVRFRVKVVGNYWRIVEPVIPPHVGVKRMVNFVRDAEVHEQDLAQRKMLTALVEALRKAK